MPLIKAKEAVDVFINQNGNITICHPDTEEMAIVSIHREDVDTIIKALQEAAQWIDENPHAEHKENTQ